MSEKYAIIRMEKYSSASSIYGISQERCRADGKEFARSDIDRNQTQYNILYKTTEGSWYKEIEKKIKEAGIGKVKADAVRMIGAVITASPEFFTLNPKYEEPSLDGIDVRTDEEKQKWLYDDKTKDFFDDGLKFFIDKVLKGRDDLILDARIDMDETTPHLQIYAVPIEGRERINKKGETVHKNHLSAKNIVGNRVKLRELQNEFHEMAIRHDKDFNRGNKVEWDLSPEDQRESKRLHRNHVEFRKDQIQQLEERVSELDQMECQVKERVQELKGEVSNLEQQRDTVQSEVMDLMQQRETEEQYLGQIQQAAEEARIEASRIQSRIEEQRKKERSMERKLRELSRYEANALQRLDNINQTSKMAEMNVLELQKQATEYKNAIDLITRQMGGFQGLQQALTQASWQRVMNDLQAKGWTPEDVHGIVYEESRRRNGHDISRGGWIR